MGDEDPQRKVGGLGRPGTPATLSSAHGFADQEAPQAHAEEEAQEDAEGDPLAAPSRQVALETDRPEGRSVLRPGLYAALATLSSAGRSSSVNQPKNSSWLSPPIWTRATWVKPASTNFWMACTWRSASGPQGMLSATSSGRTNCEAPSKADGPGSSAFTFQPPPNQRNWSWALFTASFSSRS